MYLRRSEIFVLLLMCFVFLSSCTFSQREKTLPSSVQSINVPLCRNETSEPGLSEIATRYFIEEFLADGRLDVTGKNDADALVEITLTHFNNSVASTTGKDVFPLTNWIDIRADVTVLTTTSPKTIMKERKGIEVTQTHVSDTRRVNFEPETEAKARALRTLAHKIVREVISGK